MAKKAPSTNSLIFGGILTGFAAVALGGLICITLFGLGYYLIVKYNKPGTKLLKEIQPMQYVGMFFCFLALLPFMQYFFMGLLFNAGDSVFSSMFDS
jgi:hypothetical protein